VWSAYIINVLTRINMSASGVAKKIIGLANGSAGSQDACTVKQMEDHVLAAIGANVSKDPVHAGTTGALPANTRTGDVLTADAVGAFPTIDGVPPVLNQYYLIKNEGGGASHINNGIYELTVLGDGATEWELTRRHDMEGGEGASGSMVPISDGTVNGDTTFKCINNIGSDTVNTDALEFWFWGQTTDHANLKNLNWDVASHVMNTDLDMNSNQINEVTDPTLAQDAATKNYVDTSIAFSKQFPIYHVSDSKGSDSNDGGDKNSKGSDSNDGGDKTPVKTVQKAFDLGDAAGFDPIGIIIDSEGGASYSGITPALKNVFIFSYEPISWGGGGDLALTLGNGSETRLQNVSCSLIKEGSGFTSGTLIVEDSVVQAIKNNAETGAASNLDVIISSAFLEGDALTDIDGVNSVYGVAIDADNEKFLSFKELNMKSNKIINLSDPTAAQDADTKNARDAAITTHTGLPAAHHAKYTDAEAVTAMGAKADANPLNHDKGIEAGTSFPGSPSDGDIFNRTDLDMVFRYDGGRTKWLSEHSEILACGRGVVSDIIDAYCGVGNAPMSATSGFRMPRNGTIVAVTVENQSTVTRTIDFRVNNSAVNRVQLSLTAAKGGKVVNANQDFSADDILQTLALIAAGNSMSNLIATVEVKWRA